MTWLALAFAVAAGNAAAALVGFVVRAVGLLVLVLIGVAVFGWGWLSNQTTAVPLCGGNAESTP